MSKTGLVRPVRGLKAAFLCGSALCASMLVAEPAPAQVADSSAGLETVVVTARRRSENLQDVPLSINAFSAEQIRSADVKDSSELQRIVPALNVTPVIGGFNSQVTMRGQGQITGADPGILSYFNEVPLSLGMASGGLMYDLSNVQVLKGPQGTLFGRNTTGGAILIAPKRPDENFGGYLQGTYGSYNRRAIEGAVNVPLVPGKVMARIATQNEWRDGFTKDVITGRDYDNVNVKSVRGSLLIKPFDGFENLTVLHAFSAKDNGPNSTLFAINPQGFAALVYSPLIQQQLANQQARGPRRNALSTWGEQYKFMTVSNVTSWDLADNLTLKNIASLTRAKMFTNTDFDGTPLNAVDIVRPPAGNWNDNLRDVTEEIQLQGRALGNRLSYTLGGFYSNSVPVTPGYSVSDQFGSNGLTVIKDEHKKSRALFSQVTYDLGGVSEGLSGLKVTGGVRRTWDDKHTVITHYLPFPGLSPGFCIGAPSPGCFFPSAAKFTANTYNVDVTYTITPDVTAYVTRRRGFKSGGFNALPNKVFINFGPEYVEDWEGGLKTQWSVGTVQGRFNIDGYTSKTKDKQIIFGAIIDGSAAQVTGNTGRAKAKGIDIDAQARLTRQLELGLSYAYTDAIISRFQNPVTGDLQINAPVSNTSKHKLSINADYYLIDGGDLGSLVLRGNLNYTSKYITGGGALLYAPPFTIANIRVDWLDVAKTGVDLSFFVNNVTNKLWVRFRQDNLNSVGLAQDIYGPPRMYGVQLRYNFGG